LCFLKKGLMYKLFTRWTIFLILHTHLHTNPYINIVFVWYFWVRHSSVLLFETAEKNHGQRVVLDLVKYLKRRNITCDNFFTKHQLAVKLLAKKNTLIGLFDRIKLSCFKSLQRNVGNVLSYPVIISTMIRLCWYNMFQESIEV